MANEHIVSIEREAKLSIDAGRLEICFIKEDKKHYIAVIDIAVLILAHHCIQLSIAVSKELSGVGAIIIYAGDNFMPVAVSLPIGVNQEGAKRPHLQAKYIDSQEKKFWWSQIVKSKILGQAFVLSMIDEETENRLLNNVNYVKLGDEDNTEAVCAKIYWDAYFKHFAYSVKFREKQGAGDIVNISLNYSYAIIRAIVARSLAGAGFCLNFGVGHYRKDNPFNMVEDFIEPFRFVADKSVLQVLRAINYEIFDGKLKKELINNILYSTITIQNKEYRLFQAVDFAVNSFCISLEDPRRALLLPNMLAKRGKASVLPDNTRIMYEAE
jgi:CRISPR-associated protein Cas1